MKIIAIRGRNLASLEGDFSIDFTTEPLASAGIYAISGPTGAGKSTILDAMCLALFARTPRTDQAKENNVKLRDVNEDVLLQSDPRFLLRRGTASGYAEVDFLGLNGIRYRSRWSVARARDKESGRLQNPRITLYNIDNGKEEGGSRSELQNRIVELIGLTFDQFTRSVLLAQNDFSTFLKAEQGEKASLLEKLTGTEQYSAISRLIFTKSAEAREAYEKILVQIQGIELLRDEEVAAFQSRLAEVTVVFTNLEKARLERQSLQEALKSTEQQILTKQRHQKEAANRLEQSTLLLATAQRDYEKGLEEQAESELKFNALQSELIQARRLDVQLEAVRKNFSESEIRFKEILAHLKENESKLEKASNRKQQGETEILTLNAWREKYKAKERIAEQLSALLIHLDAAFEARRSVGKTEQQIVSFKKQQDQLRTEQEKLVLLIEQKRMAVQQAEANYRTLETELSQIDPSVLEKTMNQTRSEREHLLIEQARGDIQELRQRLEEGKPCPVCGSLHHPVVMTRGVETEPDGTLLTTASNTDVFKQHIATMTLRLQELSLQSESYVKQQKQLTVLQQKQLLFHKELTEIEQSSVGISNRQTLLFNQLQHAESLRLEQSELLIKALKSADDLFGGDTWQSGWMKDPEAFRMTLSDFARQWHEKGDRLHQLEREQGAWKAECDSLASFLPDLQQQQRIAQQELDLKQESLNTLQVERVKLLSGRPADEVEKAYIRQVTNLKERLTRLMAVQNEQAGIVEQSKGIVEQISKDLSELELLLIQQQTALQLWLDKYRESQGDKSLEEALMQVSEQKSELTFRLRSQEENRKKIASFQEELTVRRNHSERWAKLNELAGSADGAKFRRIAQGYTLDVLLSYTNVQLRKLTHRYRLERVPETLALQVIDRDMCDEIRTVHSLSGGESFLVSLALALGLSSLSSNRMKVESLFIDEGFGSLDAETLRIAMDALENLRTQGRKIGVISHVQEMTERIPVQVLVNRAGNGRSYIEINAQMPAL